MKSNFHEKREQQLDRYQDLAAKALSESESRFKTAHDIGSCIPFGQPILVGHHSEKRHRRDLDKIDNNMRKAFEADEKAKHYANKVDNIENGTAISSDDPEAITKLKEKLEGMIKNQELMKAANKMIKSKKFSDAEKVAKLVEIGFSEKIAIQLMTPDPWIKRIGIPAYKFANNNGNIKRVRDRIAHLEKLNSIKSSEEMFGDIRLVVNVEDNRVQIFFPSIPAEPVRKELKSSGFRWAPTVGAWMAYLNTYKIYQAKEMLKKLI